MPFKIGRVCLLGKLCLILAIISALFLPGAGHSQDEPVKVAVIVSDSLLSTTRTLSGAKKIISQVNPNVEFNDYLLSRNNQQNSEFVKTCTNNKTDVILTVGSSATQFAKENFEDIPIIFSSVLYPALSGFVNNSNQPGKNITGASLDIPINVQFSYFKQIVPNLKKIGVMYTESTAPLIPSAKIVAQDLGLILVPVKIKEPKELPHALDSLTEVTQGLWSVADPTLFDPQATKYILKTTLRKSFPFMGFSRHVVESGALFALDFDYKAIGIQAGQLINKVIDGTKCSELQVTSTDVIYFHFNEKTAKHIKITIPPDLEDVAKEVYR